MMNGLYKRNCELLSYKSVIKLFGVYEIVDQIDRPSLSLQTSKKKSFGYIKIQSSFLYLLCAIAILQVTNG